MFLICVASLVFQLHYVAVILYGRVNTEFHVQRPRSAWFSFSGGPRSTDRDVGLGRDVRGEEYGYRT